MGKSDLFIVGNEYSRKDIYSVLEVPTEKQRGNWETGYTKYDNEFFIFVNVETSGRTGHNYDDKWLPEGTLFWHGKKNSHVNQPGIQEMLSNSIPCHIFTRNDNRNTRFEYQGIGKAIQANDTSPVEVIWCFNNQTAEDEPSKASINVITEDIVNNDIQLEESTEFTVSTHVEGAKKQIYTTRYERNQSLRSDAIRLHGTTCMACGFNFQKVYGNRGKDYIEVHHIKPLATAGEAIDVDPATDLVVVCANCHRIIHRKKNEILSLNELKALITENQPTEIN